MTDNIFILSENIGYDSNLVCKVHDLGENNGYHSLPLLQQYNCSQFVSFSLTDEQSCKLRLD